MAANKEISQTKEIVSEKVTNSGDRVREIVANPETLPPKLEILVGVSGDNWTGKTKFALALGRRLGGIIPENGQEYFNRRSGLETGAIDRPPEIDARFDNWQKKKALKAVRGKGGIIEVRLWGINKKEAMRIRTEEIAKRQNERLWKMQKGKDPRPEIPEIPSVAILITAPKETRLERAYRASIAAGEHVSKAALRARMDERKERDMKNWSLVHPDLLGHGEDPFDPNLKDDRDGTPVWDIVIPNPDIPGIPEEDAIELCVDYAILRLAVFNAFNTREIDLTKYGEPMSQQTPEAKIGIVSRNSIPSPDLHPDHPSRKNAVQAETENEIVA